jgi:HEAT repeat protein
MEPSVPFKTIIDSLLDDDQPFPPRFLHRFSDMPRSELDALKEIWVKVSPQRKLSLLDDLEELAEADTLTSFDELAQFLFNDKDGEVRTRAIRLLLESEDVKLIPIYLKMLNEDEHAGTRAAAANALGKFVYLGELDKYPSPTKKQIEDQLLDTTTNNGDVLVRRRALESLGYSGREEVPPLIEAAYAQKDPDWLVSALFAMGRSCDERWNKQVLSKLHDEREDVRSEAIHAAGELEIKSSRPTLLDLLAEEEDLEIRRELIWALASIGGEGVRTRLEELFDIEEDDVEADFIEEALGELNVTEEMGPFDLLDIDPDADFIEEDPNKDI